MELTVNETARKSWNVPNPSIEEGKAGLGGYKTISTGGEGLDELSKGVHEYMSTWVHEYLEESGDN